MEMSHAQKQELIQAFQQFDKDGDGRITADELQSVLRSLGVDASEEDVAQMMREADLDGNGSVDLEEFLAINARAEQQLNGDVERELLHQAFRVFDEDANGKIDAQELHRVLTSLCDDSQKPTLEECRQMIHSVDADGDGFVDFEEFEKMMRLQMPVA